MKTIEQIRSSSNSNAIDDEELQESLVGKGVAIIQNRQHGSHKAKLLSNLNQIQNACHQGVREEDDKKRNDLIFQIMFDFANALKSFAEMSANINNISTTAVLDTESIQRELSPLIKKFSSTSK